MRRVLGAALVAVFALTVAPAAGRDDKKATIEGTYLIVGIEVGGKALPDAAVAQAPEADRTVKFTADRMTATTGGTEIQASYTIDPTKKPAEIDSASKKGDKVQKSFGIYKVDGDKLVLCVVESEKAADRPKEFKTTAENKAIMLTLKKK